MNFTSWNQMFSTDEKYQNQLWRLKNGKITKPLRDFKLKNGKIVHSNGLEVVPKQNVQDVIQQEYEKNKDNLMGQSIVSLYKYFCNKYINITRSDIQAFLNSQPSYLMTYTPHKVVNKPIFEKFANARHQVDLLDLSALKNYNRNYQYVYVQVDVFSRKVWLRKLKTMSAEECSIALLSVLAEINVTPILIQTDNGTSFKAEFHDTCEENNIKHYFSNTYSANENAIVERANKRINKIMKQHFLSNNNFRWENVIEKIQNNLNETYLSVIKSTPNEIWTPTNQPIRILPKNLATSKRQRAIHLNMESSKRKLEKYKDIDSYEVGDIVRIKMSAIFSQQRKLIK